MGRKSKVSKDDVMKAVMQLQQLQEDVTIPAVRRIVGEDGSNTTIRTLTLECEEEIRAQQATMRMLTPAQKAHALSLMENAVAKITAELEADSRTEITECREKAKSDVAGANESERLAWEEVDERVRERDEALDTIAALRLANQEACDKASRAEGQVLQQAAEILRLTDALDKANAAKELSIVESAELRGRIAVMIERDYELQCRLVDAENLLAESR